MALIDHYHQETLTNITLESNEEDYNAIVEETKAMSVPIIVDLETGEHITGFNPPDGKYMKSKDVHISKLHLDKEIQEYMAEKGLGKVSGEAARELGSHLMSRIKENAKKYAQVIKAKLEEIDEQTP